MLCDMEFPRLDTFTYFIRFNGVGCFQKSDHKPVKLGKDQFMTAYSFVHPKKE